MTQVCSSGDMYEFGMTSGGGDCRSVVVHEEHTHPCPCPMGTGSESGKTAEGSTWSIGPHPRIKCGAGSNLLPQERGFSPADRSAVLPSEPLINLRVRVRIYRINLAGG